MFAYLVCVLTVTTFILRSENVLDSRHIKSRNPRRCHEIWSWLYSLLEIFFVVRSLNNHKMQIKDKEK